MKVLVQRMTCGERVTFGIVTGRIDTATVTVPTWITVWPEDKQPVMETVLTIYNTQADCDATYIYELEARATFGWVPDGPPFLVEVPNLEDLEVMTVQAWAGIPVYQAACKAVTVRDSVHGAYLAAMKEWGAAV